MTDKDKEKLHQILSSLWENDNSVGKIYYNQALQDAQIAIDSLQEEPVSGLNNDDMPIERWKQAVAAASNQRNYRSSKGLTETRDDYFVDGVQWADKHPKEEPVSEDLEVAAEEARKRIRPLFESIKESTGEPVSAYDQHDMIEMFKAGAMWQKSQLPKWEKRPNGGCWSGEIAVHPSARLFRYEHYVINADKLFELLSKEE